MKLRDLFESPEKTVGSLTLNGEVVAPNGKCRATWSGDLDCSISQLTSLEGAPSSVGGDFFCSNNQLKSLEGAPSSVGGYFYCFGNQLTSLEGAPSSVGGDFYCSNNQLTSLEGAPSSVGGDFYCFGNQLTSLEGAPSSVGGSFSCSDNRFKSISGIHLLVKEVGAAFYCSDVTHVLGLCLIKGLKQVVHGNKKVQAILNRHLGQGRAGLCDAQDELLDAGLDEYAKL